MGLPELIINGIAAAGAVAAAGVALGIATKDRRDRRAERRAADMAQARLVLVEVQSDPYAIDYRIDVNNHGAKPILSVELVDVRLVGEEATWTTKQQPGGLIINIIQPQPDRAPRGFTGQFCKADGSPVSSSTIDGLGNEWYPDKPDAGLVIATIEFSDANGNTWRTDNFGRLSYVRTTRSIDLEHPGWG
ncbi:hypothetical protein [Mycobacteroides abscessus]|uniref:hypothetical protein n=1 Tax=Mycobacteroides abscessus TaxID=36809 RepID=UPI0009440BF7|nr:hypothetical protein [Mycobacteroides abscessus]